MTDFCILNTATSYQCAVATNIVYRQYISHAILTIGILSPFSSLYARQTSVAANYANTQKRYTKTKTTNHNSCSMQYSTWCVVVEERMRQIQTASYDICAAGVHFYALATMHHRAMSP